jgi:MarR family transcriptional regulator, organic hydroperoxide resistance regulator
MDKIDYLRSLGAEAIGARLRRLSERIDRDAAKAYGALGIRFEQRWFGVLNQLRLRETQTVSDIARTLRISHVSVSQARKSLEDAGLIVSLPSKNDARRKEIRLTNEGRSLIERVSPVWTALNATAIALVGEVDGLMDALDRLDEALDRSSFYDRTHCALNIEAPSAA